MYAAMRKCRDVTLKGKYHIGVVTLQTIGNSGSEWHIVSVGVSLQGSNIEVFVTEVDRGVKQQEHSVYILR